MSNNKTLREMTTVASTRKQTHATVQPRATSVRWWALYQWGSLWLVARTKRECIKYATDTSGEPWRKCRNYYRVERASVIPDDVLRP